MAVGSWPARGLPVLTAAGAGVAAFLLALGLVGRSPRLLAGALLVGGAGAVAVALRRPREVFLFAWVVALTYNRQYFLAPTLGAQSPYVIAADVFLLLLAGLWIYESVFQKRPPRPAGSRVWPWYLPFALVCLASATVAVRPDWTLIEFVRVLKVGFVLVYASRHLGPTAWWTALAGFAFAILLQSAVGVTEVLTGRSGLLWVVGMQDQTLAAAFDPEVLFGRRRAIGTMSHPPNLACYLLLVIPVFVALGLTHPQRRLRIGFGLVGLAGLAGLVATFSRWPWLMMSLQLVVLLLALGRMGAIPLRRSLGILALAGFVGTSALLLSASTVQQRFTGDLAESVHLRSDGNRMALAVWRDHNLLLGVGLNNYRAHLPRYAALDPAADWELANEEAAVAMNSRFITAPLNGFLFVLIETGILGMAAFLVWLLGVVRLGWAAARGRDHRAAIGLGLLVGILGMLGQQAIDYSYWVDPVLYSFALVVGMLARFDVLAPSSPPTANRPSS